MLLRCLPWWLVTFDSPELLVSALVDSPTGKGAEGRGFALVGASVTTLEASACLAFTCAARTKAGVRSRTAGGGEAKYTGVFFVNAA